MTDSDGVRRRDFLKGVGVAAASSGLVVAQDKNPAPRPVRQKPTSRSKVKISLTLNGKKKSFDIDARTTLVDLLRENEHMTGTKKGCDHGACGACTVHVNGKRVLSCLTLAATINGENVATIEGISDGESLHPLQEAFLRCDAYQCGYCMRVEYEGKKKLKSANSADEVFGDGVETSLLAILANNGKLVGMYPGDFAVTFVAFGGLLVLASPDGERVVAARDFYRAPIDSFQYTTALRPNEVIKELHLPMTESLKRSMYFKVRDRSSYAFALASCSVGLQMNGNRIVAANVGLGGIASIPWHSAEAEQALVGESASDETFERAATAALADANPPSSLEFKVSLAKNTIVRALQIVRDQGPLNDEQLWAMQHGRG